MSKVVSNYINLSKDNLITLSKSVKARSGGTVENLFKGNFEICIHLPKCNIIAWSKGVEVGSGDTVENLFKGNFENLNSKYKKFDTAFIKVVLRTTIEIYIKVTLMVLVIS